MSIHEYERLLDELSRETSDQAKRSAATSDTHDTRTRELSELEDRLLDQQAELLHTANALRIRIPKLGFGNGTPDGPGRYTDAVSAATREIDNCDIAMSHAMHRARQPNFLPHQRALVRHLAVYGLCVLGATALQLLILASGELTKVAWVFLAAPLAAFAVGYLAIGTADQPRIKPAKQRRRRRGPAPTRDPKLGLIICVVIDLAVAVAWLLRTP